MSALRHIPQRGRLVDANGLVTPEWLSYLSELTTIVLGLQTAAADAPPAPTTTGLTGPQAAIDGNVAVWLNPTTLKDAGKSVAQIEATAAAAALQDAIAAVTTAIAATSSPYVDLVEQDAPPDPEPDTVRLYAEDDGAGKTRLMALFPTGSAIELAIEA